MSLLHVLVLLVVLDVAQGMYMVVGKEGAKCFSIDQPRDTPVSLHHEILDHEDVVDLSIYYGKTASQDMAILKKQLSGASGVTDFMTDNDGEYTFCVQKSSQVNKANEKNNVANNEKNKNKGLSGADSDIHDSSLKPTRLKLKINYGFSEAHYSSLLKEDNFDAVNMEVRKLNDMMDLAINEADYQKHKEMEYHTDTESMNHKALWWPVCQIGILVVIGIFQVQHLKHFFKTNKLI